MIVSKNIQALFLTFSLFFFFFVILAVAVAQGPVATSALNALYFAEEDWDPGTLNFLENEAPRYVDVDTDFSVPPPPLNDSAETQAELDVLRLYAREGRTPEQLEAMKAEHFIELVEDTPITPELLERLEAQRGVFVLDRAASDDLDLHADVLAFTEKVFFDMNYFSLVEKRRFGRVWPTQLAPDLEAVFSNSPYPSYPSEYAVGFHFSALVLGYIDPVRADGYRAFAAAVALRFEVAGLHYPSDTVAGVILAEEFFEVLLQNIEIKNEIDSLKLRIAKERSLV